jgi:hypothetical protein
MENHDGLGEDVTVAASVHEHPGWAWGLLRWLEAVEDCDPERAVALRLALAAARAASAFARLRLDPAGGGPEVELTPGSVLAFPDRVECARVLEDLGDEAVVALDDSRGGDEEVLVVAKATFPPGTRVLWTP